MSFPVERIPDLFTNEPIYSKKIISCRKEHGFVLSCTAASPCAADPNWGKASESVSLKKIRGSITIEAALSVPLFLFAALSLVWLLEMHSIQTTVRCALQAAGKQAAQEYYEFPYLSVSRLNNYIVENIGEERLEQSMVVGGSEGIHCEKSRVSLKSGIIELKAEYQLKLPIPVFAVPEVSCSEEMKVKAWTGYVKSGFAENISGSKTVYITETGIVYHKDFHCTYLEPSIHSVALEQIEELRNQSLGRYYPCERCMKRTMSGGNIYITDYGDRYHCTLECSGLKRKIYAIPISEVGGKRPCSKCGN